MSTYTFSDLNSSRGINTIPPKTRTVQKSPLYTRMEKLKIGEAFVIEGAKMASVAANVYATAKRIGPNGIKVTLRQLEDGVGVWRVRNTASRAEASEASETSEENAAGIPSKRRGAASGSRGRGRKAA